MSKPNYNMIHDYIIDVLKQDMEDTEQSEKGLFKWLSVRIHGEYGYMINRLGMQKAMAEWLQGLALPIAYWNDDILVLAKKWGSLSANPTEAQEAKIIRNYWMFMSSQLLKFARKAGVNL